MQDQTARGLEDSPTDCSSSIDPAAVSYPQDTEQITVDELFQALGNRRRRRVIHALEGGTRDLGALARAIAAVENDITTGEVNAQQRKRVYISLYQSHLEKLDEWNVVEWDAQAQTIAPGPAHETAIDTMRTVAGVDDTDEAEPSLLGRVWSRVREVRA